MGDKTGIQWCDATWNPIRGCSRVSEGCRHCYAEAVAARFCGPGQPYEGLVKVITKEKVHRRDFANGSVELRKVETRDARWNGEVRFVAEHLADPLRWKTPRRIFVNSMSDLFHERLTNEQIAAVFGVMAAAPQHTFIVLTKRARRMREWFEWIAQAEPPFGGLPVYSDHVQQRQVCCRHAWMLPDSEERLERGEVYGTHPSDAILEHQRGPWPLPNVILGVSVENQAAADERIPDLLATPAAVRAISAEPLLGPLDLSAPCPPNARPFLRSPDRISWVIAGCESGPGARVCSTEWLRSLRDQCAEAGVAYFLKQAREERVMCEQGCGEPIRQRIVSDETAIYSCGCTIEGGEIGSPTGIAYSDGSTLKRGIIGLPYLDGKQWAQFPEVKS